MFKCRTYEFDFYILIKIRIYRFNILKYICEFNEIQSLPVVSC